MRTDDRRRIGCERFHVRQRRRSTVLKGASSAIGTESVGEESAKRNPCRWWRHRRWRRAFFLEITHLGLQRSKARRQRGLGVGLCWRLHHCSIHRPRSLDLLQCISCCISPGGRALPAWRPWLPKDDGCVGVPRWLCALRRPFIMSLSAHPSSSLSMSCSPQLPPTTGPGRFVLSSLSRVASASRIVPAPCFPP